MTEYERTLAEKVQASTDVVAKLAEAANALAAWLVETAPEVINWMVETLPYLLREHPEPLRELGLLCEQPDLLDLCPNRRVKHLAKHGRKRRTRKKNRSRAYRLIAKEADK